LKFSGAQRPRVGLHHRSMENCEPLDPLELHQFETLRDCFLWFFEIHQSQSIEEFWVIDLSGEQEPSIPYSLVWDFSNLVV